MSIQIDIINRTTGLQDAEIAPVISALDIQVNRDFKKYWGIGATLHYVPVGTGANKHHWWLALIDNADTAGALGYHDLTSAGLPLGKVFVKTTQQNGGLWSVTASHELLEMLGDPEINLIAQVGDNFVAYETCDAVEDDTLGYQINGVTVSDFVTPLFFSYFHGPDAVLDFQKKIQEPLQILPGGYLSYYIPGKGWVQKTAQGENKYSMRPQVGSRRERRRTNRYSWLVSTAE